MGIDGLLSCFATSMTHCTGTCEYWQSEWKLQSSVWYPDGTVIHVPPYIRVVQDKFGRLLRGMGSLGGMNRVKKRLGEFLEGCRKEKNSYEA